MKRARRLYVGSMEGLRPTFEVRIHGRGGQGVVTAAELLSIAAFDEGRHAQAFPSFGSERDRRAGRLLLPHRRHADPDPRADRRARRADRPGPDAAAPGRPLQRPRPDGYVLINTGRSFEELGSGEFVERFRPERLLTVPATELARRHLGRPLPNAALLGGFAALTGLLRLDSVTAAIREQFPGEGGEGNAAAAEACFEYVAAGECARWPVLRQIEGSAAVAETVGALPARGRLRLPDLPPDPHRRGPLRPGPRRQPRALRVRHRRVGVRGDVGLHRRLGDRRPRLHGDRQPGPALHGRGALQRLRARPADRDDRRQPGDRRPDQHLERPQRHDVAARLRLDPALRGDQPGGGRPARPGLPDRRASSRCR